MDNIIFNRNRWQMIHEGQTMMACVVPFPKFLIFWKVDMRFWE